jgi:hypothetical protein
MKRTLEASARTALSRGGGVGSIGPDGAGVLEFLSILFRKSLIVLTTSWGQ